MIRMHRDKGKNIGDHFIFENHSEAVHYLSGELASHNTNRQDLSSAFCFKNWTDQTVIVGDWIVELTGKIAQVLAIYVLKGANKKIKEPNIENVCIKTAGGLGYYTRYIAGKKKGTINFGYGLQINDKSLEAVAGRSLISNASGGRPILGKTFNMWKRLFVYYLVIYMNPVFALRLTLEQIPSKRRYNYKYKQLQVHALSLLKEDAVQKEIGTYMSQDTFRTKLLDALNANGLDEIRVAQELVEGLEEVKKGTHSHLEFIQTISNLIRHAKDGDAISPDGKALTEVKKIHDAESTEFDLLPSPPIAVRDIVDATTMDIVVKTNDERIDRISEKIRIDGLLSEGKIDKFAVEEELPTNDLDNKNDEVKGD